MFVLCVCYEFDDESLEQLSDFYVRLCIENAIAKRPLCLDLKDRELQHEVDILLADGRMACETLD